MKLLILALLIILAQINGINGLDDIDEELIREERNKKFQHDFIQYLKKHEDAFAPANATARNHSKRYLILLSHGFKEPASIRGTDDTQLTDDGHRQAQRMGIVIYQLLLKLGVTSIDFYSSPFVAAIQTAARMIELFEGDILQINNAFVDEIVKPHYPKLREFTKRGGRGIEEFKKVHQIGYGESMESRPDHIPPYLYERNRIANQAKMTMNISLEHNNLYYDQYAKEFIESDGIVSRRVKANCENMIKTVKKGKDLEAIVMVTHKKNVEFFSQEYSLSYEELPFRDS